MQKRSSGSARLFPRSLEVLEERVVQSGLASTVALPQGAVEVAAHSAHKAATQTTLAVNAGTLGQPITFSVAVKASGKAGAPTGTVNLVEHGQVIQSIPLATGSGSSISRATYTLNQPPGDAAVFFGKYPITAQFIPSGSFSKSSTVKTFVVRPPAYTTLSGGVQVATIAPGSGPAIQSGQTASVLYTGYLLNGQIFDDSVKDGGPAFSFKLGSGQVIPGFDLGVTGMQVGESRIVKIPAAEAYGASSAGIIPPNSDLIFVMTLTGIS